MQFELEAACFCTIGRVRKNNEDNFYFDQQILEEDNTGLNTPLYLRSAIGTVCFAVFDGMGGHADGQTASYLAARAFQRDCAAAEPSEVLSEEFFSNTVTHMNDAVCMEGKQRNNNMGTTAVILGFCGESAYLCNVGDSRAYRFRQGQIVQISMDHVEMIQPSLTVRHGKPRLSQCIGIPSEQLLLEPYLAQSLIKSGDIFLLCSDGLSDLVMLDEISNVLSGGQHLSDCVCTLIELALDYGGKDNITAIVIRILEPDENNRPYSGEEDTAPNII